MHVRMICERATPGVSGRRVRACTHLATSECMIVSSHVGGMVSSEMRRARGAETAKSGPLAIGHGGEGWMARLRTAASALGFMPMHALTPVVLSTSASETAAPAAFASMELVPEAAAGGGRAAADGEDEAAGASARQRCALRRRDAAT